MARSGGVAGQRKTTTTRVSIQDCGERSDAGGDRQQMSCCIALSAPAHRTDSSVFERLRTCRAVHSSCGAECSVAPALLPLLCCGHGDKEGPRPPQSYCPSCYRAALLSWTTHTHPTAHEQETLAAASAVCVEERLRAPFFRLHGTLSIIATLGNWRAMPFCSAACSTDPISRKEKDGVHEARRSRRDKRVQ